MNEFYCETQLSEKISKTPEGFLVCHDVPITIAGDMYYLPDQVGDFVKPANGHIRVSKKIEEIHSPETIKSFEGKPITIGHPRDNDGKGVFVNPENSKQLTHGVVQNVRPGSGKSFDKLLADFVIMDKNAIEKVERGELREVSCGYGYEAANIQDGFFEQTNIRGNHVALVKQGRAGPQCAIFDSKEETKKMSLKDKLKEAISIFTKAVDEAVPEDAEQTKKGKVGDESPMQQAMEDMAVMNLDSRLANLELMFAELTTKLKSIVFDKIVESVSSETAADSNDEENKTGSQEESFEAYDSETLSQAEVLAPGISKLGKDIKKRALDECYKTDSGKKIIDSLLCGKSFDSSDKDMLFVAASTLIGAQRSHNMKQTLATDSAQKNEDYRSAAIRNRKSQEFWSKHKIGVSN